MDASQGRIAVAVAMISVLGAIATGVLTNWDKIFGSSPAPQASANAAPPASSSVVQNPGAVASAAASGGLAAAETATPAASESYPNIGGRWIDAAQETVEVTQQGPNFVMQLAINGELIGQARGELRGQAITYSYDNGDARCVGVVRTQNFIEGTCNSTLTGPVAFQMRR